MGTRRRRAADRRGVLAALLRVDSGRRKEPRGDMDGGVRSVRGARGVVEGGSIRGEVATDGGRWGWPEDERGLAPDAATSASRGKEEASSATERARVYLRDENDRGLPGSVSCACIVSYPRLYSRGAMRAYARALSRTRRRTRPFPGSPIPSRHRPPRAASPDHFLLKPRPLSSAYRSMKRMKRFHSAVVFIT